MGEKAKAKRAMENFSKPRCFGQKCAIHHSYWTINDMSILTPHNKSHTAGPQSSPSHMEALRRIRQAYQRQLEQMQITHVLDTRGSDFLAVIF